MNATVLIRRLLARMPLGKYLLRILIGLRHGKTRGAKNKGDWKWVRKIEPVFGRPLGNRSSGKVLVFGDASREFVALQSVILKSFEIAGYEPVLICECQAEKLYRALGVTNFIDLDKYLPFSRSSEASQVLHACKAQRELVEYTWNNIRCGKYAVSTAMRLLRQGSFSMENPTTFTMLVDAFARSLSSATAALRVIDEVRPTAMVFLDRGYSPEGEFFDVCVSRGIACFSWNAAHKNDCLMLKRYNVGNRDVHPCSLADDSWNSLRSIPWTCRQTYAIEHELAACYANGQWYGEVGTQFNSKAMDAKEIACKLGLDSSKRTVVIFSHIFWDATFFYGKDLFEGYEDWFVHTVRAACANTSLNWIVKVHPANVVKDRRDGVKGDPSEIRAIRDRIGDLPAHVKVLDADTEISTWSLYGLMDICLTVRGTVGIEAALCGKSVVTAGTGRYDRLGFTHDFESREAYIKMLAALHTLEPMTREARDLAQRYAFGVFLCRPVQLRSLRMCYVQDEVATLDVQVCVHSQVELEEAGDLIEIARYLQSGREDFFLIPYKSEQLVEESAPNA